MSSPTPQHPLSRLPPLARARVMGAYAKTAVDTAQELGADLRRLGQACGLPHLDRPLPERLPVERYLALLDAAAAELGDPFFGLHVGERMRMATFAGYGLVLCTCKDFREAVAQTVRYEGLAHDLGRSEVVVMDDLACYRWYSPWLEAPGARHLVESVAAGVYAMTNWLAGVQVPLVDLGLTHAAPAGLPLDEYQRVFGAPVRFGAPVTEARTHAAFLDLPLPNADPSLSPAVVPVVEARLAARRRETEEAPVVLSVRRAIQAALMHDTARLPEVAAALGLTARTLQRKLAESGETFSTLLEATRRELAQGYLRDDGLSLTDVAFLLGFGEQSNFNHAFRAWFGTTPAAWRAAHRGAPVTR